MKNTLDRRSFIGGLASAAAMAGCTSAKIAAPRPEPKFYWSYLAHFGSNLWKDLPLEEQSPAMTENWLTRCQADYVRFDEPSWRRLSAELAKAGCNQIVIDLAEILEYPSHPELAVKGSWSPDRMRDELNRLRGMGFEVIPKLNFSTGHDSWLKEYHRMVSSRPYYQVCADVIRDTIEIFDYPRLLHLGLDEETEVAQRKFLLTTIRYGDLWWHDLNFFFRQVEKHGVRPWVWTCHRGKNFAPGDFLKRMPRSVLQSNWYYGAEFDVNKMTKESTKAVVRSFEELDKAGYDQVPTGSNYSCDTNFAGLVQYCDKAISAAHLKGYMMASWVRTFANLEPKAMQAIAQLDAAKKLSIHSAN